MNKNNRGESLFEAVMFLGTILIFFGVGTLAGCVGGTKDMRVEAVKKGYAEWVTDERGNATFVWKCDKPQLEKGK
jgi:hypothetical protein